tara:strand:+ start:481 stop:1404 length:924 start_codon:yes stop_codon:yes gene_type:complete
MAFAQNSRSGLSYVVESTFGTTPATPTFVTLPYSTQSLQLTKERVAGNDIQSDEMTRVDRHGNRTVAGEIAVDLRMADYDPFLESVMGSAWATDVLKVGTTAKYFSIEDGATDISQYRLFTGCTVSTMAVSIAPNQMVTANFTMVGQDMAIAGTTAASSLTASSTNAPFDSYSGDMAIGNAGGSSSVAVVTGIDFTVSRGYEPTYVVGSDTAPCLVRGRAEVEGTFTAYFEDETLVNRFLNETETEIEVSVDDPTGSNPYTFMFPRCKINGADVPVDANTGPRVISIPFVAIYDTTEDTNIKITRST